MIQSRQYSRTAQLKYPSICTVNIGKVLLRKCDYDSAENQFCTALEIYNKKLPGGHPKIAAAKQHLDRVEQEKALCV